MSADYKVYFWKQANLQEMKDNMIQFSSSLLQDYTTKTPVETLWSQIHNHLLHLLNTFVSSKMKHNNNHKPWINHTIKQLRSHKQNAYNKVRSTNLSLHWTQFKELKRQMQREC